jgi:hypothetical protein
MVAAAMDTAVATVMVPVAFMPADVASMGARRAAMREQLADIAVARRVGPLLLAADSAVVGISVEAAVATAADIADSR